MVRGVAVVEEEEADLATEVNSERRRTERTRSRRGEWRSRILVDVLIHDACLQPTEMVRYVCGLGVIFIDYKSFRIVTTSTLHTLLPCSLARNHRLSWVGIQSTPDTLMLCYTNIRMMLDIQLIIWDIISSHQSRASISALVAWSRPDCRTDARSVV